MRVLSMIACLVGGLAAPQGAPVAPGELPTLRRLGALPESGVHVAMDAAGALRGPDGAIAAAQLAVLAAGHHLVLDIDRTVAAGKVIELLAACEKGGLTQVFFGARLPDGTPGCFALALSTRTTTFTLTLHRNRPGVSPDNVTPLLRRMAAKATGRDRELITVEVRIPADAGHGQLLTTLGAIAAADVAAVTLRAVAVVPGARVVGAGERDGDLAMDLGPSPSVLVSEVAGAVADTGSPAVVATFGFPVATPLEPQGDAGRVGVVFGGRRGAANAADDRRRAAIVAGQDWLCRHQDAAGSWHDDAGHDDVGATALALLSLLGEGHSLDRDTPQNTVSRGVGWLLAGQDADGALVRSGPQSIRAHAQATWALSEVSGVSPRGQFVRGAVRDALAWLVAQRSADGGWRQDARAGESDTITMAWSVSALVSARFFDYPSLQDTHGLLAWLDLVADADGGCRLHPKAVPSDAAMRITSTAGGLFARLMLGQSTPGPHAVEQLVTSHENDDPRVCCWTTFVLYQVGGEAWQTWGETAQRSIVEAQQGAGEFEGSWNPAPGDSRAAATAMRLLALHSFERYARIR